MQKRSGKKRGLLVVSLILALAVALLILWKTGFLKRMHYQYQNWAFSEVQLENGVYRGTTDWGRLSGQGEFDFSTGETYSGEWDNYEITGYGTLQYPEYGTYTGDFSHSERSGFGTFLWNNGDKYEGEFSSDKMNGNGVYIFSDGRVLQGTFRDNAFISGTYLYSNQEGQYCFTIQSGGISYAEISYTSGIVYKGDCDDKGLNGEGYIQFKNGDYYNGSFKNGLRHGSGKYTWKNGDWYDGSWEKDKMCGKGEYAFADGDKLTGSFKDNKFVSGDYNTKTGNGTFLFRIKNNNTVYEVAFTLSNGFSYDGDLTDGDLTGTATITYTSGDRYNGKVVNGIRNGQGTYHWRDGSYYKGEWVSDKMEGEGEYYYPNNADGYKLVCTFKNNMPIGEGTYFVNETLSYGTTWKNGKCVKVTE